VALPLLLAAACGGGASRDTAAGALPEVPARATTAGDALLPLLPPGADAIAEIDVARLRANPAAGKILAALPAREVLGFDPARDVDYAVAAVYAIAGEEAATLFVLRGAGLAGRSIGDATQLDERTVAIGPAALRARTAEASAPPPAHELLVLRTTAMPERAAGAALRITARLDKQARIAAAGRLGLDEVPATLSLWLDVADDAALIALLGGADAAEGRRLAAGVEASRERLLRWLPRRIVDGLEVEARGAAARVVWVIPPRRFAAWADELARTLAKHTGGTSS
jgi:hypothetical protein